MKKSTGLYLTWFILGKPLDRKPEREWQEIKKKGS
jgi:hypothetical protein